MLKKTLARLGAGLGVLAAATGVYGFVQVSSEDKIQCWNGSREANEAQCAPLSGASGLEWLFPSLTPESRCELSEPKRSRKTAVYVCSYEEPKGGYLLRYTAWTDVEAASRYYARQYDRAPSALMHGDERVGDQWSTTTYQSRRGMPFKASGAFYAAPFSWSVEASSAETLELGRHALMIRPVDHWRVDHTVGFWARLGQGLSP